MEDIIYNCSVFITAGLCFVRSSERTIPVNVIPLQKTPLQSANSIRFLLTPLQSSTIKMIKNSPNPIGLDPFQTLTSINAFAIRQILFLIFLN